MPVDQVLAPDTLLRNFWCWCVLYATDFMRQPVCTDIKHSYAHRVVTLGHESWKKLLQISGLIIYLCNCAIWWCCLYVLVDFPWVLFTLNHSRIHFIFWNKKTKSRGWNGDVSVYCTSSDNIYWCFNKLSMIRFIKCMSLMGILTVLASAVPDERNT